MLFHGRTTTALHLAMVSMHIDVVRLLAEADDVDLESRDPRNWTPLHMACERDNDLSFARLLISAKSDVNSRVPGSGITPLLFAANRGNANLATLLVNSK